MSNFSASIPIADMAAANAALEEAGWGPNNFSIPLATSGDLLAEAEAYVAGKTGVTI